ncbi:sensor histidine kinase KdpD [Nonomuraea sp. B12E4]|uniref:sensor histidine kinase KdpD n=1 Tax=Nonomuraea sp. B12E4 TaxID=3153564 RepID=UPI00325E111A
MQGISRGRLRVYLGAAPGVGKTFAMLGEAHRARERGKDVVVGFVETHGRALTTQLLEGLEVVPRKTLSYRGTTFTELDPDAVIERAPALALIDELAHTNVPGSRNAKRWEDIEEILDAGIDVVSTLNIQHLESLNDVVEQITGVPQRETVPDEVVRRADRIELVDMSAEALRRRMAHGNVYPLERVDAALANYFRVGNLTALRELALLWVADKVDQQLDQYRAQHSIVGTWETRERVVVALTGGPEGDTLIRRAARIAVRSKGADLMAVHVTRADGLTSGDDPANLVRQRSLVEDLGGTYHQVIGDDVPRALLEFSHGVNATQLVLGASRRGRFAQLLSRGVGVTAASMSGSIDVHMVTHEAIRKGRQRPRTQAALTRRRRLTGWGLALLGIPLLTVALRPMDLLLPSNILLFLLLVVGAALTGGMWPALTAAVFGFGLLNWYFTPPLHTLTIASPENVLALAIFVLVAAMVSAVVDLAARRSREAAHARADAEVLSTLAGHVLRGEAALPSLLRRMRETFGLTSVTLLERAGGDAAEGRGECFPDVWKIVSTSGGVPCTSPGVADIDVVIDDSLVLAADGRVLEASDRRVLEAFAAQAAVALRQQRLREEADRARPLAEADRMRTALLAAVSHDLRTPLASAMAAVESLRGTEIAWSDEDRAELLATADESLIKLSRLVSNLLDMSRLQAGALGVALEPVAIEDILPRAIDELGLPYERIKVDVPPDVPDLMADPALLERVLVNLMANAARYQPEGEQLLIAASWHGDNVEVRIIDRGPGIPQEAHERVFMPFQRLGDRDNHAGVGLGLALSRGLTEAMGGTLVPDDTPGGGLTMTVSLRRAP